MAFDSVKMALSGRGMEECVDVPLAVSSSETPDLSAVEMLTYWTLPSASLMIHPPSLSANSQSILSQCLIPPASWCCTCRLPRRLRTGRSRRERAAVSGEHIERLGRTRRGRP